jgi:large exoprotein involved in heme utilization and adhesion
VAAAPNENSDITANAFTGRGGRVTITANSIFGLIPRSRLELETLLNTSDPAQLNPANLPTSDITAISQANPDLSGEVVIQTPDTNPIQGATNLPTNLVDASRLIAQGCSAGQTLAQRQGSLIVTGRGGLPPSPTDQLREDNVLVGWESLNPPAQTTENTTSVLPAPQGSGAIAEAQSLKPGPDGRMTLTAQAPGGVMSSFWNRPAVCTH